jgi:hypothetical protein
MTPPLDDLSPSERELTLAVRRLRRGWRMRVLTEGAARVAVAALLAVLAGAALAGAFGAGSATVVTMRVLGYLLIAAAAVRYLVVPALRRPTDARLALYVEERAPELKQTLLSAVHELGVSAVARPSPGLSARVMEQALAEVRRIEAGPGLERSRLGRAAAMLGGVAAATALLLVIGPPILKDAAKAIFIPWSEAAAAPVFAVTVTPGDAQVPKGGAIELAAALRGFAAEAAELVMKADTATEWVRVPMLRDSAEARFTSRIFDLTRSTVYYVESDGVRSRAYTLTVVNLPAVDKLSLDLRFPAYTGLPVERIEEGGDVAAVRGTTVTVRAHITMPVRSGTLQLDGKTDIPLKADSAGRLVGSFRVTGNGFYRINLVAEDGTSVPGKLQYVIEALEDHGPTIRIEQPGRDTKVTSLEEVAVAVRASDDYGVKGLELRYSVNGGAEHKVPLTDSTGRAQVEMRAAHTLFLEELGLKPGDLVSYHVVAGDGAGNSSSSDIYFLEVRPFGRDYRQAEQGGGGGGGQSPEGLSARQREVVAGTFNWLRDSARTAERERRENVTTLAIAQGRIKQDVAELVRRLVERNVLAADTAFKIIHAALDTAGKEMQAAEEHLGMGRTRDALPREQRALQLVQRAEAAYREVQVQLGEQGGGGGGGGQSRAEDLADLFELETDKMQNQYESVQQEQQQSAQQELDETAERLKRLASRQQQENERMQRMADELRNRMGQQNSGGGGGGGQQRQLAREAEEEARRLERLARERNSPELADAARRLQEAADAMKRAAGDSPNSAQQGGTALDKLRGATKELENARTAGQGEQVRELSRRAEELGKRQQEISQGVKEMAGTSGADRAERMRRLGERKDGVAQDVDRLQADAERVARQTQREQPATAGKVGKAAEAIREDRIRDKVLYSKEVMRSGSAELSDRIEGQITQNLEDVAGQLREAAGALTESADARRERALERARELVRGLESLRERIGDRQAGDSGSRGSGNQGQQPGQQGQGQQGQGQQGQGQQGQGQQGQGQQGQGQQGQGQQGQGQGAQQGQGQGQGGQQGQQNGQGGGRGQQQGQPNAGGPGDLGGSQAAPRGGSRLGDNDARQFGREFRMRREAAESLRRELSGQNMDVADLDRAIADLRRLESGRPFNDAQSLAQLQQAVIEGLKSWEFRLWRAMAQNGKDTPAMGAPAAAPPEYRALVEEYYRSLARKKTPP